MGIDLVITWIWKSYKSMSNYVDKLHKMLIAGWVVDECVLTVVLCCKRVLWPRGSRLKHPTSGADYLLLWDLCWVGWECRLCRKSFVEWRHSLKKYMYIHAVLRSTWTGWNFFGNLSLVIYLIKVHTSAFSSFSSISQKNIFH